LNFSCCNEIKNRLIFNDLEMKIVDCNIKVGGF